MTIRGDNITTGSAAATAFETAGYTIEFPPTVVTMPVQPGRYAFINAATHVVMGSGLYTPSQEIEVPAGATGARLVIKPGNNLEANVVYPVFDAGVFVRTDGTRPPQFVVNQYSSVLLDTLEVPTGYSINNGGTATATNDVLTLNYTLGTGRTTPLNVQQAKTLLLAITDTQAYINHIGILLETVVGVTGDLIVPVPGSTNFNATYLQMNNTSAQVFLPGVTVPTGTDLSTEITVGGYDIRPFVAVAPQAGISAAQVAGAVNDSETGRAVANVDNKTDYIVTNGNATTTTYDRFVGIKPKTAVYDPNSDYTP